MKLTRRRLIQTASASITGLIAGCASRTTDTQRSFSISSPAMENGGTLPARYTCDGAGESPPFEIQNHPDPTAALAITGEYDRGPINEPVFWSIWNIPPERTTIPAGIPRTPTVETLGGAPQGRQRGGEVGYKAPCPPPGQPYEHRFQLYALGEILDIEAGTKHDDAVEAIGSSVLASARLTVTLQRSERTSERTTQPME
ncbi:YbhB/YbcL family Raf kinase inhibitor-like protein [Haloarcula sp. Atlit-7R]|nr:YbhB/YbcL family Raf kinase inhibitor-like protein [Haloarcula sp. Atlit-7R]